MFSSPLGKSKTHHPLGNGKLVESSPAFDESFFFKQIFFFFFPLHELRNRGKLKYTVLAGAFLILDDSFAAKYTRCIEGFK